MKALRRLIFITLTTLITLILGVLTARQIGQLQAPSQFKHHLLNTGPWVAATAEVFTTQLSETSTRLLYLNARWSGENQWVISANNSPFPAAVDNQLYDGLLIDVTGTKNGDANKLIQLIDALNFAEQIAITSSSPSILNEIRKLKPLWLYGADSISLIRYKVFSALFLETVIDIKPDFVIASADPHSPRHLDSRLHNELRRRGKKILLSTTQQNTFIENSP